MNGHMSWLRLIEERMKSKTPGDPAAGDEFPVEPARKARIGGRFRHLLGEMWPAYLIEIVVIILGISITLALEEWRDGVKEEKLENLYRKNLLADINADLGGLQKAAAETTTLLAHGQAILQSENGPAAESRPDTALTTDLRAILGRPNFIPHDATFAELKSSGNLHLLKDVDLKWLLFAFYNQARVIKEVQDAEQQATINLVGPYFLQRIPMDDGFGRPAERAKVAGVAGITGDTEFRNMVLLRVANRRELLAAYETADSLATQVKATLLKN
jgi:hypothetical protein